MKKKDIYIETENLAIPEVHVKKDEVTEVSKKGSKKSYKVNVDVAVPEVKVEYED